MLEKCAKKTSNSKSNQLGQVDSDSQWTSMAVHQAGQLLPSAFASQESTIDPALTATPRMGLRERKKPMVPATAPPSTVKKRQQRIATPRTRKSLTAADTFVQDSDAPPVPVVLERELSPGAGLSALMQTMKITNGGEHANFAGKESAPGTPTPVGKGHASDVRH
jgi:hypothetical protein